ncbi:membrane hypothetical protein [Pseudomonas sp. 8Z]|uniref:hypothetical protein n=1 Tax=Pseudomonas sp. 8Z TaxID=2653166 RepID=UPI0012EF7969|nr:hypothetical protein [Pseudomonas sp. 8Z]VXD04069.1 membrane hypothetical protein [Pseudomonas sp. 8Z]
MPVILTVIPIVTGDAPFFVVAGCFLLAGCIPFIMQLSTILRLCLIIAVISSGMIYDDPHRWPDGLLLMLGLPLILYFILRGSLRLLQKLGAAIRLL